MTERLGDIEARIATVHQIEEVVGAMRGIAAMRTREAREQLDGIRSYAETIAGAIGQALAFLPPDGHLESAREAPAGHAIIALCAEQGFAGAFSDRILDAVDGLAGKYPQQNTELLLIGDRGLMVAGERELAVDWSAPMVAHPAQAAALASRIAEALYERLDGGQVTHVTLLHTTPDLAAGFEVMGKQLIPFDFARFPLPATAVAPLTTLAPQVLLVKLAEEYVFAEICEAVMLSFAAENEARMRAMIAARANVADKRDSLVARARQLRQEEITNEIIELAGGSGAQRRAGRGKHLKRRAET